MPRTIRRPPVRGYFRTPKNEPNLRTISMANRHFPTLLNHIGNMNGGLFCSPILAFNTDILFINDQRITTNGDDGEFI